MSTAVEKLALSARGYDRIRKVARTIADLELAELEKETGPVDSTLGPVHLAEALQLRRAIL